MWSLKSLFPVLLIKKSAPDRISSFLAPCSAGAYVGLKSSEKVFGIPRCRSNMAASQPARGQNLLSVWTSETGRRMDEMAVGKKYLNKPIGKGKMNNTKTVWCQSGIPFLTNVKKLLQ